MYKLFLFTHRWFTVLDSDLVVNANQLASITADIEYNVPAGGLDGNIKANAKDVVNGETDFIGNMGLLWAISDGGNAANFVVVSAADVASGPVYNASSEFIYGSNKYYFDAIDTVSSFLSNATGGYGGDAYQW